MTWTIGVSVSHSYPNCESFSMNRLIIPFLLMTSMAMGADAPTPEIPVAAISLTDGHGIAVRDEIPTSSMLIVTSEKAVCGPEKSSLIWIVKPQMSMYRSPDDRTLVITTPKTDCVIEIMQIVALNNVPSYQLIKVTCGDGSQPPPGPGPDPAPGPKPVPTASKLFLSVVEDSANRTPDTAATLNAMELWNSFRVDGSDWRFYDLKTGETKGKKAIQDALKANIPPPALVISDIDTGKVLGVMKLPAVGDLKSTVSKYQGGAK